MKRIAAIHDLSGIGRCSLTAAIPVISALGVEVCPIPTAVLTSQTGYTGYDIQSLTGRIARHGAQWQAAGIALTGIYVGFLDDPAQIDAIQAFAAPFRQAGAWLLVDPVMGDSGMPYPTHPPALRAQIARLCANAEIITPNLTELCLLTGQAYEEITALAGASDYIERIAALAQSLLRPPLHTVVVTGIRAAGMVYNLCVTAQETRAFASPALPADFSGTGDLFASVIAAGMAREFPLEQSLHLATEFVQAAIAATPNDADPREGVWFERVLRLLTETV